MQLIYLFTLLKNLTLFVFIRLRSHRLYFTILFSAISKIRLIDFFVTLPPVYAWSLSSSCAYLSTTRNINPSINFSLSFFFQFFQPSLSPAVGPVIKLFFAFFAFTLTYASRFVFCVVFHIHHFANNRFFYFSLILKFTFFDHRN